MKSLQEKNCKVLRMALSNGSSSSEIIRGSPRILFFWLYDVMFDNSVQFFLSFYLVSLLPCNYSNIDFGEVTSCPYTGTILLGAWMVLQFLVQIISDHLDPCTQLLLLPLKSNSFFSSLYSLFKIKSTYVITLGRLEYLDPSANSVA